MKRSLLLFGFLLAGFQASAQPVIWTDGVVNGASMAKVGLPNSAIVPGSLFVVFGERLGPEYTQAVSWPLATSEGLGGTSVEITAGGQTFYAPMLYTSPGQVSAVLPSNVLPGKALVKVRYGGQVSNAQEIDVARSSFGIFAVNQQGSGPGVLQNWYAETDQKLNDIAESATPGGIVILWGTGLGATTGNDATQEPLGKSIDAGAKVYVAGREVTPIYAGRSGCCAGVDQIVFRAPDDVIGCSVPVMVRTGDVVSNAVTMSIAPKRGGCSDELSFGGLSADAIKSTGLAYGSVLVGHFTHQFQSSSVVNSDIGQAGFVKWDFEQLRRTGGPVEGISVHGACTVATFSTAWFDTTSFVAPQGVDAGPELVLTIPGGGTKRLSKTLGSEGGYAIARSNVLPEAQWVVPGDYTITGPGGTGVGEFSATITVPAPLVWTNRESITEVDRSKPLRITWSGGSPDETVWINGTATIAASDPQRGIGAAFRCLEKAGRGEFTIPMEVLLALPRVTTSTSEVINQFAVLTVSNTKLIPVAPPRGLDKFFFAYLFTDSRTVNIK